MDPRGLTSTLVVIGAAILMALLASAAAITLTGRTEPGVSAVPAREATRPAVTPVARAGPKRAAPPSVRVFLIAAARGDCWLEARESSASGPVLYHGLLEHGRSVRLTAKQLWVSVGAAGNLDVTIDGKPLDPGLEGTVETVLLPESHA